MDLSFTEWSTGPRDPSANSKFVDSLEPVLRTAMRSYAGSDDPVAHSRARILALEAANKFDPTRGVKLNTYLLTQLQPLRRLAQQRMNPVRIPESVQYEASALSGAEKELTDLLGREPTDQELSDHASISMKRLRRLREFGRPVAEGQISGSSDNETPDLVTARDYKPEEDDWVTAVYYDLPAVNKKIFEWRTGYNGNPRLGVSEIAKRLGISAGRVSQIASAIGKKLTERPRGV